MIMGLINVNANYRIQVDNQFTVRRLRVATNKDTGEKYDIWDDDGYFSSLSSALKDIKKSMTKERAGQKSIVELGEYIEMYLEESKKIDGLLNGVL